jgi:type IV secretory pathway VirB2 component (pilin)
MNDIKDTAATVTTIAGGGMAVMGINEWLTLALLITGIVLNIVRIRAINKDKDSKK